MLFKRAPSYSRTKVRSTAIKNPLDLGQELLRRDADALEFNTLFAESLAFGDGDLEACKFAQVIA